MSNLYSIEQELLNIFNELEDNGGELTPELEEKLKITEKDGRIKLENYCKFIKSIDADANACKEEYQRLSKKKKSYENNIVKAKSVMLDYIINFGDTNKSGNKGIKLPTFNLYITTKNNIKEDEFRTSLLCDTVLEILKDAYDGGAINQNLDDYIDSDGFLNVINANAKCKFEADTEHNNYYNPSTGEIKQIKFIPFIKYDLDLIDIDIITKVKLSDLLKRESYSIIKNISEQDHRTNIIKFVNKITIKEFKNNGFDNTISLNEVNNILNIR